VDDYTVINNFLAARHSEAALQRIPAAVTAGAATCSRTKDCHSMPNWHHTRTARGNMHQRREGLCREIHL
jgi:hypothetical protein